MSDLYEHVRSIPFPVLASALGIDLSRFKRAKNEYVGPCPYHKPKNNTGCFRYHDDGRFNCFVCLKSFSGRGAVDFIKLMRVCYFTEAVAFLEPLASQPSPYTKKEPVEAPSVTEGVLQPLLKDTWKKFAQPCAWLEQRIPDAAIRERYGVYMYNNPTRKSAYSNRVMIPVRDVEGNLYGYLGRNVEVETGHGEPAPKYLFPKNLPKSSFLFGAHELKSAAPVKVCYLVESPFATLKFASMGLACVASYGWSVSQEQIAILAQLTKGVVWLPDNDKFQDAAAHVSALAESVWVRFPRLPEGCLDPESLSLDQILAL